MSLQHVAIALGGPKRLTQQNVVQHIESVGWQSQLDLIS